MRRLACVKAHFAVSVVGVFDVPEAECCQAGRQAGRQSASSGPNSRLGLCSDMKRSSFPTSTKPRSVGVTPPSKKKT